MSPYGDQTYEPIHNVPIVIAATGYTTKTGKSYILVFNEALGIPTLYHALINPNQLLHHYTKVQDNLFVNNQCTLRALKVIWSLAYKAKAHAYS